MAKQIRYTITFLGTIDNVPNNYTHEDIIKAIEKDWDGLEHDLGYANDVEYDYEEE